MNTIPKWAITVAVLLVVASTAFAYAKQRAAWQARIDNLEARVVVTNAAIERYVADSVRWAAQLDSLAIRDSALTSDSAEIAKLAVGMEEERQRARADLSAHLAELDRVPPSVRRVLDSYESALDATDSTLVVCEDGRSNAEGRASNCETQKVIADSTILALEKLRSSLTSERDSALVLLKPPPLLKLTFDVSAGVGCASNFSQTVCGASTQVTFIRFRLPWP